MEYLGKGGAGKLIQGAKDDKDALKKFRENKESFIRPVVSHKKRSPKRPV